MWTVKSTAMPVQFRREQTGVLTAGYSMNSPFGINCRFINIPTKSKTSESETVGGLGQQILLQTVDSKAIKPISKEKEISGSDVLWAIQRATAQRQSRNAGKKNAKKIRGAGVSSSVGKSTEDNGVDCSNVRPLRIESDWGQRLEEFEKLLKEFQNTEL